LLKAEHSTLKATAKAAHEELSRVAGELDVLHKERSDARCREWLQGAQGKSDVLGAAAAAALQGGDPVRQTPLWLDGSHQTVHGGADSALYDLGDHRW
jgi:hypothetical protein